MRLAQKAREENNVTTASIGGGGQEVLSHFQNRAESAQTIDDEVDKQVQQMMKQHDFPDAIVIRPEDL